MSVLSVCFVVLSVMWKYDVFKNKASEKQGVLGLRHKPELPAQPEKVDRFGRFLKFKSIIDDSYFSTSTQLTI